MNRDGKQTLTLKRTTAKGHNRDSGGSLDSDWVSRPRSDSQQRKMAEALDIAIIARNDEGRQTLARELMLVGAHINVIWPIPEQLPIEYEVVFCEFVDDLPTRIPWLPGEPSSALVLIAPSDRPIALKQLQNCAPQAVLHRPITPAAVQSSLMLAQSQFQYDRRLRSKIDKMQETIRNIRTVERAKAILMMRNNLNESEAYRRLRKQAMERRTTVGGLAQAIIDSQEILC